MKRIKVIMIIIFSVSFLSFNIKNECREYFNGKWKYDRFEVDYIYVQRSDKKQFEFMNSGKYYYEFDINWITNCKYELTYIGTTSPNPAAAKIGEKFLVEIITINDSITEYKTVFRGIEDLGKMTRIK